MPAHDQPHEAMEAPLRYRYDSPKFGRVVSLSDGVFAIALTLLVLTLDVPQVPVERLAQARIDEAQQVVVFALSFALVANLWWFHHKIVAQLAVFETGMIAINLALLGLVALVPFPTNLVGSTPTSRAAVLPLLAVFLVLSSAYLALVLRAQRVEAWRVPVPDGLYAWLVAGWVGQVAGVAAAMAVAVWLPVGGLVVAVATGTVVGVTLSFVAPRRYREWRSRPGL